MLTGYEEDGRDVEWNTEGLELDQFNGWFEMIFHHNLLGEKRIYLRNGKQGRRMTMMWWMDLWYIAFPYMYCIWVPLHWIVPLLVLPHHNLYLFIYKDNTQSDFPDLIQGSLGPSSQFHSYLASSRTSVQFKWTRFIFSFVRSPRWQQLRNPPSGLNWDNL